MAEVARPDLEKNMLVLSVFPHMEQPKNVCHWSIPRHDGWTETMTKVLHLTEIPVEGDPAR